MYFSLSLSLSSVMEGRKGQDRDRNRRYELLGLKHTCNKDIFVQQREMYILFCNNFK